MAVSDESAYEAARAGAAVLDRGGRGKLVVAGSDRRSYLHAMLTNDIGGLAPGTGGYAAYLTPQGRMIADMRVLELGDVVLMDLDRQRAGEVIQKLDQFVFSEDVQFGDVSATFGLVSIVGPGAAALVSRLLSPPGGQDRTDAEGLAAWPEFRNARSSFAGQPAIVVASTELGERGFDVFVPAEAAGALVEGALSAGAARLSDEIAEVLRVEAGRPAFGVDMDSDTIPLEAGIEGRAISLTKGCYPGQEVVIRVLHRGHGRVARKLAGLLIDGSEAPSRGDALRSGDRDAGRVTSAVMSPALGRPIALAMVQRDFLEPGTRLDVQHGDARLDATVTALPFVDPR
ncbi:MAG: gcvT 3 [Acidobacteria bacterium]|nr:gcvT 3 [Acidobacteriota bacterium]